MSLGSWAAKISLGRLAKPKVNLAIVRGLTSSTTVNPTVKFKDANEQYHKYGQYLMTALPKFIQEFTVYKDELALHIAPSAILPVLYFLRDHYACQFKSLADICGVDFPTRSHRFEVVYNLLSLRHNARIRVKLYADEATPVPSVTRIFSGANWFEREVYDLYGIFFVGHPDLRRILTDYGFEGHPLRKDFPLTGYKEVRYDEEKKRIVYEPLELAQTYRNFEVGQSNWESAGSGIDNTPRRFQVYQVREMDKK